MNGLIKVGCAAAAVAASSCAERTRPNIIYILADDLGYNELGCYGQEKILTPHIDKLAEEGIKFTQHYSGQAVCAPSRCVMLTGRHTGHSYIRDNKELPKEGQTPIPAETVTIAKLLKQKGYATGCVGKWGLGYPGSEGDPNNQGFDLFYGYNCQRQAHFYYPKYLWKNDKKVELPGNKPREGGPGYASDLMSNEVLGFIKDHKDKPFYLYYASPLPHVSLQITDEMLNMYKGKWDEKAHKGSSHPKGYTGHPTPRAAYAAMISHLDRDVGRITALLKELKIDDNTLIIFTSDNGATHAGGVDYKFFNSVGELRGLKGSLWEGGIRVPFVAKWPGKIKPGSTSDHISGFQDMMPTIGDITGYRSPADIDGISFLPTLLGTTGQAEHKCLYWEFKAYGGQQAVRMGKWKGIRRGLQRNPNAPIQLYNLETDLSEKNDLAKKYPEVVEKIQKLMQSERVASKVFPFKALDK